MAWTIEYTATARKQLRKFDKPTARQTVDYLDKRIAPLNARAVAAKLLLASWADYGDTG